MNPKMPEVKALMERYGISQQALANLLLLSRASISRKFNLDDEKDFTDEQQAQVLAFLESLAQDIQVVVKTARGR